MISYLSGKIILKEDRFLILNVNGVGYKIFLSSKKMETIEETREGLSVFCYLNTKKDLWEIYAFLSLSELELFEALMKVSGIGPKAALEASSLAPLDKLRESLELENEKVLNELFILGKKKAEAIIFELSRQTKAVAKKTSKEDEEVIKALSKLGFSKKEITESLSKIKGDELNAEDKIKKILKIIGK